VSIGHPLPARIAQHVQRIQIEACSVPLAAIAGLELEVVHDEDASDHLRVRRRGFFCRPLLVTIDSEQARRLGCLQAPILSRAADVGTGVRLDSQEEVDNLDPILGDSGPSQFAPRPPATDGFGQLPVARTLWLLGR
jgi:hypothetical protein